MRRLINGEEIEEENEERKRKRRKIMPRNKERDKREKGS